MKVMPLPIHLQLDNNKFIPSHYHYFNTFAEPTSVLDSARFPKWRHDNTSSDAPAGADSALLPIPPSLEIAGNPEKLAMDDWESVLSESVAAFPNQEQSFLRWIMGDVDDPAQNKSLQIGSAAPDLGFSAGFGANADQGFCAFVPNFNTTTTTNRSEKNINGLVQHNNSSSLGPNLFDSAETETKPSIFQPQNPSFFFPLPYPQQQSTFGPFTDTGQQHFMDRQQVSELGNCHQLQQQAIVDQIYKAAELVQTGNPVLAQGILARLNHHPSLVGKPFHRAAVYCKEALQMLLNNNNSSSNLNPFSLVFKISAYKSFSEISPLLQFANFTCNQAILEALEGFDRVHIVDFDIGLGGQWGSLMQELALRPGGLTSLKVTALCSMSPHHQLELGLTRENLIQFASEVNIPFEFDAVSDSLNSGSWFRAPDNEAVVVNLPIGSLAPFVLRFVKHLSPRIVVTMDRGCDRTDLPFANHVIHALQSYSNLLESLDAVNVNMDALQKIERFLLQPGLEKVVTGRFQTPEKTQHWRDMFLSSGLSPVGFSNFAESQAECLIKRTPVRGFQVEKRQSSLVLCWQRKELISVSAWRVC